MDVMVSARRDLEGSTASTASASGGHSSPSVATERSRAMRSRSVRAGSPAGGRDRETPSPGSGGRRSGSRPASSRNEPAPPLTEPMYELPEPAAEVTAALRQLPAQQRAAVVLHYYADRPIREIAGAGHVHVDGRRAPASRPEPTSRPPGRRRCLISASSSDGSRPALHLTCGRRSRCVQRRTDPRSSRASSCSGPAARRCGAAWRRDSWRRRCSHSRRSSCGRLRARRSSRGRSRRGA